MWLKSQRIERIAPSPETITGENWEKRIKGRTGIVYFADYWTRGNEKVSTGDHIDLWNGSRLTASGLEGAAVTFLRFGLGIESGPGFSSLSKAKTPLPSDLPR
ncbi:T6SS effector amidase Tae4 family protein [Roseateles sp. 22389]|uniref:T6SS effector amidase Tae4 family protein n=1 Tax=Roseateles sp. 22389 TaxID=3453916 RepID=UPI003F852828